MLSRAVHLARPEFPFLEAVRAGRDGCLDGLDEALRGVEVSGADQALLKVLTSLLDLLGSFIGEELTLVLVAEVWPDSSPGELVQPDTSDGPEATS